LKNAFPQRLTPEEIEVYGAAEAAPFQNKCKLSPSNPRSFAMEDRVVTKTLVILVFDDISPMIPDRARFPRIGLAAENARPAPVIIDSAILPGGTLAEWEIVHAASAVLTRP